MVHLGLSALLTTMQCYISRKRLCTKQHCICLYCPQESMHCPPPARFQQRGKLRHIRKLCHSSMCHSNKAIIFLQAQLIEEH